MVNLLVYNDFGCTKKVLILFGHLVEHELILIGYLTNKYLFERFY